MSKGNRNRKNRMENPPSNKVSSTQRKMMEDLVKEEILRQEFRMSMEVDSAWLWVLFMRWGFTEEQLHRLYKDIEVEHKALREYYEAHPLDGIGWLYKKKLLDHGMDVERWYAE